MNVFGEDEQHAAGRHQRETQRERADPSQRVVVQSGELVIVDATNEVPPLAQQGSVHPRTQNDPSAGDIKAGSSRSVKLRPGCF
jgi:hypothetical protein